jgi:hypothetical protein
MHSIKKILLGIGAFAALALGGAALAGATGSNGDGDGEKADDGPDKVLTGTAATKAGDAATSSLGGGKTLSVENSDEGGPAVYEVKVDKAGKTHEVQVSKDFQVTGSKLDDDQGDQGDQANEQGEHGDQNEAGEQDEQDEQSEQAEQPASATPAN